jgi:hypothetical protein
MKTPKLFSFSYRLLLTAAALSLNMLCSSQSAFPQDAPDAQTVQLLVPSESAQATHPATSAPSPAPTPAAETDTSGHSMAVPGGLQMHIQGFTHTGFAASDQVSFWAVSISS